MENTESHPAGRFFRTVLVLVNGYLVAFALDALLSFLDDSLRLKSIFVLEDVRNALAGWVVFASYLAALLLVFIPRLPKSLLIAPALFSIWGSFGMPPLAGISGSRFFGIGMDILEIAFAAGTFGAIRMRKGFWVLRADGLPEAKRVLLKIVLAGLVAFVAGGIFFAFAFALQVGSLIESKAGTYMRLTMSGVDLQETVLVRKTQKVRLVAMAHIGKPQFYESLYSGFPPHALMLEEGVSDRKGILAKKFSYQNFAGILGYTQQPSLSTWKKRSPSNAGSEESFETPSENPDRPFDVVRADLDVSDLSDSTIRFLKKVGELYQSRNLGEFSGNISAFQKDFKPEQSEDFFKEAIELRNAHLLKVFDAKSPGYAHVVIPWGALHMPGLEKELVKRGFQVESRRYLPHSRYRDLLSRK